MYTPRATVAAKHRKKSLRFGVGIVGAVIGVAIDAVVGNLIRYVVMFFHMLTGFMSPLIDIIKAFGLLPIGLFFVKRDRCGRNGVVHVIENDGWAVTHRDRNRRIREIPEGFTLVDPG
ncbi:MAG: hypothetical protein OXC95_04070 [Dehalococcoidia bacterium]|nr:hypothetical protein [Dehalococcoidia bacterium]